MMRWSATEDPDFNPQPSDDCELCGSSEGCACPEGPFSRLELNILDQAGPIEERLEAIRWLRERGTR